MHKLLVSSSPHIHTKDSIASIMLDVMIALTPACLAGIWIFGYRAALVLLTTIAFCLMSEYVFEKIMKRYVSVGDLSAVVTGLLLGMNLPVTIPLWMAAVGSVFAIIIVKQMFGGIGKNFMNPALAGRCFMLIAWTGAMTSFTEPFLGYAPDAVSSATPLAAMAQGQGNIPSLLQAFLGNTPGTIGETSALSLIIGFIYLLLRRVVHIRIPAAYLLTFAVLTFFFGKNQTGESGLYYTVLQVLTGGLLLGAFFMATDYVTTPTTVKGQVIFGVGCGILTFAIRQFGGYPEGVSFSIILMNVASPLIERYTVPLAFGHRRKEHE